MLVAALALLGFPLDFLDGTAAFWRYPKSDFAEHIIGARYFVADMWRWPLLLVPQLGPPPGTNIGLTDSIPLAGLVAKLLRGRFNDASGYIPIWVLLCFLMQGPSSAILLYTLGIRNLGGLVLGGLIGVFTPVLLYRFGHSALCAQFVLLLGLAVHLRQTSKNSRRIVVLWHLPLLLIAVTVHIYLFAMQFAIMLASMLQGLWQNRLTLPGALGQLVIMAAVVGVTMGCIGYLSLGPIPLKAYGESPLDLAAPFFPAPSGIFGSSFPADRNHEDFAWLGSGGVFLLVGAVIMWWRRLGELGHTWLPTVLMSALLLVFAVTYAVRIGPWPVLGIDASRVREAVLTGARNGGTLHLLLSSLGLVDCLRIGGYGLLLVCLAGFFIVPAWQWRRHRFLIFVSLVLLAMAALIVVRPSVIALVISNFQASARFAWPVIYLVGMLAIAAVWHAFPPRAALPMLAAALLLQFWDTAPLWQGLRQAAASQPQPPPDEPAILGALVRASRVVFVPTYLCEYAESMLPEARDRSIARLTDLEVLVSRYVLPINSVRSSRMTAIDASLPARCDQEREAARQGLDTPGLVTIVLRDTPEEVSLRSALATRTGCTVGDGVIICGPQ
jgi:hypothetical protein